jgi:nicotinamidase-related amidase
MPQLAIEPRRSALVFFDMINSFIHPADAAREKAMADTGIVTRCAELLQAARAHGLTVAYACGSYRPGIEDGSRIVTDADMFLRPWTDGPQLMPKSTAVAGTPEAEVIPELAPLPTEHVIAKHRWSAFAGTHLDLLLRGTGVDTVLLAGVATDVGVAATMFDGRDRGYHMVVLRDACLTPMPGAQEFCMERQFPRMGRVMTVEQAIDLLQPAGAPSGA